MPARNYRAIHLDSVDSTNSYAKKTIKCGGPSRLIVTAREQRCGRGRGDNAWVSPAGGLYLTIAAPLGDRYSSASLGARVALAVQDVLAEGFSLPVLIKWPNDLLCRKRKLAGLLLELIQAPSGEAHLIVGLGCNVNAVPEGVAGMWYEPTSLKAESGREVSLPELAACLADAIIEAVFSPEGKEEAKPDVVIRKEILALSGTLGEAVTVLLPSGERLSGIARDINSRFALVVEHAGELVEVDAGDCIRSDAEV